MSGGENAVLCAGAHSTERTHVFLMIADWVRKVKQGGFILLRFMQDKG
jgi:hypothetical protein